MIAKNNTDMISFSISNNSVSSYVQFPLLYGIEKEPSRLSQSQPEMDMNWPHATRK